MAIDVMSRRFSVENFERMAAVGILGPDERVELLEGVVVPMTPVGDRHVGRVNFLGARLTVALHPRAIVQVQSAIRLAAHWMPLPDLAVLRHRADYYETGKARAADILLVIEIADTSVARDRDLKLPAYGRAGIPEAWVVDLESQVVLLARDPDADGYRSLLPLRRGSSVNVPGFPDVTLTVDEILGPTRP
ncbi:MAG TPA: Uma2 family endonuclease [Candidatus Limnocylindrales bacterium]|nr:Uma2 family endonuclease [Candidatus Limnocylindrales bacterium]